jgi:adiponectin receptor
MPFIYYGFYYEPSLQKLYWIIVSFVAFAYIAITLSPRFRSPKLWPYRAIMYTFLGLTAIISIINGIFIYGWAV